MEGVKNEVRHPAPPWNVLERHFYCNERCSYIAHPTTPSVPSDSIERSSLPLSLSLYLILHPPRKQSSRPKKTQDTRGTPSNTYFLYTVRNREIQKLGRDARNNPASTHLVFRREFNGPSP